MQIDYNVSVLKLKIEAFCPNPVNHKIFGGNLQWLIFP